MNEADLRETVRRIARKHLEATHPERLVELDVVFDTAFDTAVERVAEADLASPSAPDDPARGLAFDAALADLSVVGLTVLAALQLLQNARLTRRIDQLRTLIDASRGLSKAQKAELQQIAEIVIREETTWRPARHAEPMPVEALQLIVRRSERHGRPLLEFRLHGEKGGRSYEQQSFGDRALDQNPARSVRELFDRMVMRDPTSEHERAAAERWVQQRGAFLFELFLPEALQAELRNLARSGGDLLVISDEPWIPWEVLKFPATEGDEARFLAEAFALARWLPGAPPAASLPLRRIAVVRSGRTAVDRAEQESAVLLKLAEQSGRSAEMVAAESVELTDRMAQGLHDAYHLIGHGDTSRVGGEWAQLALDDRVLNPQDLSDTVATGLAKSRPFVFMNACHVGAIEQGLTGAGGWAPRFLDTGAGAFLGPLWAIPGDRAAVFSRLLYERLFAGQPIGEAVRQARLALRERFPGDPTWLAYALYADPAAVSSGGGE